MSESNFIAVGQAFSQEIGPWSGDESFEDLLKKGPDDTLEEFATMQSNEILTSRPGLWQAPSSHYLHPRNSGRRAASVGWPELAKPCIQSPYISSRAPRSL